MNHPANESETRQLRGTAAGRQLDELCGHGPCLVVLVRHAACVFCRQMLHRLARQRKDIEQQGVQIVVVHMMEPERASAVLAQCGLQGVPHVADPDRDVYRAMGIQQGSVLNVMGPRIWWPALKALLHGHLPGIPREDVKQLPGAVLIREGEIVRAFRPATSAGIPDFADLARD